MAALFVSGAEFDKALSLFLLSLVEMTSGNNTTFRENAPLPPILIGNIHFSFQVSTAVCHVLLQALTLLSFTQVDEAVF